MRARTEATVFRGSSILLAMGIAVGVGAIDAPPGAASGQSAVKEPMNLGVVKQQVRDYYGQTTAPDGTLVPSTTSAYGRDVQRIERLAEAQLRHVPKEGGKPAIVLDVDDTSLSTYSYLASHDFALVLADINPVLAQGKQPAVFGMQELALALSRDGYAVFWITGRNATLKAATVQNLAAAGYPAPTPVSATEDGVYTAPAPGGAYPSYVNCAADGNPACSTTEYKSGTRAHIQQQGFHIVANFGDQESDLRGGYADHTYKLPNPMYLLP
ncbi:MAG: HAD family acid phosphatase [Luteibacter sp.]